MTSLYMFSYSMKETCKCVSLVYSCSMKETCKYVSLVYSYSMICKCVSDQLISKSMLNIRFLKPTSIHSKVLKWVNVSAYTYCMYVILWRDTLCNNNYQMCCWANVLMDGCVMCFIYIVYVYYKIRTIPVKTKLASETDTVKTSFTIRRSS